MWWPDDDAWGEFEDLVQRVHGGGQSLGYFEKHLLALAEQHRWSAHLPVGDRRRFHRFALFIFRCHGAIDHGRFRHKQLQEAGFRFWVYRLHDPLADCAPLHARFDGIALPTQHPFWGVFFPPNGPECRCSLFGCRTVAGIRRLNGDPDKVLPEDWADDLPAPGWRGTDWLDLRGIFAAALREIAE